MATEAPCRSCGILIQRTSRTGRIPAYCGDACKPRCTVPACGGPQRKKTWCAAHYAQSRTTGKPPVPFRYKWAGSGACVVCNGPALGRRRYCSAACQQLWFRYGGEVPRVATCVGCGGEVDLVASVTRAGHRKRADMKLCRRCRMDKRKHGLSVEVLARRDGLACGICGEPVDLSLRAPELMRASVDHRIPRARGGSNDPENLQLAHLWCNQVKSDRIVPRSGERMVS